MRKYIFSGIRKDTGERITGSLISPDYNANIGKTEIITIHREAWEVIPESVMLCGDSEEEAHVYWETARLTERIYAYRCPICHTTWDCASNFCPNCGQRLLDREREKRFRDVRLSADTRQTGGDTL